MKYASEQSQAVLRAILESPKDIVIFALDREYCYMAFNENHRRTMKAIWGADIEVGCNMLEVIGRRDDRTRAKQNFDRALAGESFSLVEEYGDERINRRYYEDIYSPIRGNGGEVIGLTLYLTDITEQRQARLELERYREHLEDLVAQRTSELEAAHAQLLHAQKLEGLGVLAGGIAHDFNNLLSAIFGHADIALQRRDDVEAMVEQLKLICSAVVQAGMLTDQLLAYSGKGKFVTRPLDLSATVHEMVSLLSVVLPKSVRLACDLAPDLPAVQADSGQMRQIVMNLVTNGAEAISGRGEVQVHTCALTAGGELLERPELGELVPGARYVSLEVTDNGCGMDADTRSRIFDPFFSTKFSGRGLGLAAVMGIVRSHGGALCVDSDPGRGTTFTILLPASDQPAPLATRHASEDARDAHIPAGSLALVVDDDVRVREVTAELLRLLGLRVLQAADGLEASRTFREHADAVDVVLLDLTMPGLSGEETLQRLQEIRPDIDVVLFSGYTEDDVRLRIVLSDRVQFLHKPFQHDELVNALSNAFARPQRTRV